MSFNAAPTRELLADHKTFPNTARVYRSVFHWANRYNTRRHLTVIGNRLITACLGRRGVSVHRDTVRRVMRRAGRIAAQPRRKVRTTAPATDVGSRPDLMGRDFTAKTPGGKWVGNITCIRTWVGYVYLATVLDSGTMKDVGYAMAALMRTSLVCEAVDIAVRNCPTGKGETIFRSDRGSQYTSEQL